MGFMFLCSLFALISLKGFLIDEREDKKMKIKRFKAIKKYTELMEELLWRYCYPVGMLKRILVTQIY